MCYVLLIQYNQLKQNYNQLQRQYKCLHSRISERQLRSHGMKDNSGLMVTTKAGRKMLNMLQARPQVPFLASTRCKNSYNFELTLATKGGRKGGEWTAARRGTSTGSIPFLSGHSRTVNCVFSVPFFCQHSLLQNGRKSSLFWCR